MTNLQGYETSTDYERLWELAQVQSVVCEMATRYKGCQVGTVSSRLLASLEHPAVGAMTVFVTAPYYNGVAVTNARLFSDECADVNLRWLIPNEGKVERYEAALKRIADEGCCGDRYGSCGVASEHQNTAEDALQEPA